MLRAKHLLSEYFFVIIADFLAEFLLLNTSFILATPIVIIGKSNLIHMNLVLRIVKSNI